MLLGKLLLVLGFLTLCCIDKAGLRFALDGGSSFRGLLVRSVCSLSYYVGNCTKQYSDHVTRLCPLSLYVLVNYISFEF